MPSQIRCTIGNIKIFNAEVNIIIGKIGFILFKTSLAGKREKQYRKNQKSDGDCKTRPVSGYKNSGNISECEHQLDACVHAVQQRVAGKELTDCDAANIGTAPFFKRGRRRSYACFTV